MGVGCLRKEESPSLPKPSVWVESCPLIPPHSSPGCSQTGGFVAVIRFEKFRTHGLLYTLMRFLDCPLCPRQNPVTLFLTPAAHRSYASCSFQLPWAIRHRGLKRGSCEGGFSENLPQRWDLLAGQRQGGKRSGQRNPVLKAWRQRPPKSVSCEQP